MSGILAFFTHLFVVLFILGLLEPFMHLVMHSTEYITHRSAPLIDLLCDLIVLVFRHTTKLHLLVQFVPGELNEARERLVYLLTSMRPRFTIYLMVVLDRTL